MDRNILERPALAILRRALLLVWLVFVGAGLTPASDAIAQEAAEDSLETAVEEAAEDSVETAVEEAAEDSVEEAVEEAAEDSAEEAVEEAAEDSVEEAVEEAAEDSVEEAVEEAAEDSVEAAVEEAAEDSVEAAVEEAAEDSVEEAVEEAAEDSVEEAVEEAAEDSVEATVENEMEDAVEEAVENEVEDEAAEAVENEVEDEAAEAVENEVEDEAQEAIENEVEDEAFERELEDEAPEAAENEVEDEAAEAVENEVEDDDYDDGRHSAPEISGQLYAELEEIGQRDFVIRQELLALADATQIQQLADIAELTLVSKQSLGQLTGTLGRFRVDPSQDLESIRSRLQRMLPAAAIDFNHGYEIAQATTANSDTVSNGLAGGLFRLPAADRSAGLKIGMVDTAVDTSHSVFADTRIVSRDFLDPGQRGSEGHGTAVASLLVGQSAGFQGVLPNADLYAASVFARHPEQALVATSYGLIRALEWLSEMQVDAINISLAGPANAVVAKAMSSLTEAGVLVVAAVGNEGPFAEPRYPAAYRKVVGVTAIDRQGRLYSLAGRGEHVDYAGPGVAVTVARQGTVDGYQQNSGTSFATPIVTGLLLHYLSAGHMRMEQLDSAIGDDFVDLGKPGRDALFGQGLPGRAWIPEHLRPSK